MPLAHLLVVKKYKNDGFSLFLDIISTRRFPPISLCRYYLNVIFVFITSFHYGFSLHVQFMLLYLVLIYYDSFYIQIVEKRV